MFETILYFIGGAIIVYLIRKWIIDLVAEIREERMKDYTHYPVYSQAGIQRAEKEAQASTENDLRKSEEIQEMLDREEKKEGKIQRHKDFSDEYKGQIKRSFGSQLRTERKWEVVRFMIESNTAVLNGKKTIKQAHEEWDDRFSMFPSFEIMREEEKQFKEWEEEKGIWAKRKKKKR